MYVLSDAFERIVWLICTCQAFIQNFFLWYKFEVISYAYQVYNIYELVKSDKAMWSVIRWAFISTFYHMLYIWNNFIYIPCIQHLWICNICQWHVISHVSWNYGQFYHTINFKLFDSHTKHTVSVTLQYLPMTCDTLLSTCTYNMFIMNHSC